MSVGDMVCCNWGCIFLTVKVGNFFLVEYKAMFSSETCGADQEVELQVYIRYIYLYLIFNLY